MSHPVIAVPNRLAELRAAEGLSQEQAAEALGVSYVTYNRWENGRINLKGRRLKQLADFFGVEPPDIFRAPPPVRMIPLARIAETDAWHAATDVPAADAATVALPVDPAVAGLPLVAAAVSGAGADLRYPDGSAVFYLPFHADGHALRVGARYVVLRQRGDGLEECSVRRLVEDAAARYWLVAESSQPGFAAVPTQGGDDATRLSVLGRILRAVVTEPSPGASASRPDIVRRATVRAAKALPAPPA